MRDPGDSEDGSTVVRHSLLGRRLRTPFNCLVVHPTRSDELELDAGMKRGASWNRKEHAEGTRGQVQDSSSMSRSTPDHGQFDTKRIYVIRIQATDSLASHIQIALDSRSLASIPRWRHIPRAVRLCPWHHVPWLASRR